MCISLDDVNEQRSYPENKERNYSENLMTAEEQAWEEYDAMPKPDLCPMCNNMSVANYWEDNGRGLEQYFACTTPSCFWTSFDPVGLV